MRLLLAVMLVAQVVVAPPHPDPYPKGQFCTPKGIMVDGYQTADHPCSCKRMAQDCDEGSEVAEDAKCNQWCHKDHCGCPVSCPEGHHAH